MNKKALSLRARLRRFALGHAIADELDILVSNTLVSNRKRHEHTVQLRKLLMSIERKLKASIGQ